MSTLDCGVLRDPEVLRFVAESERWYPATANEADAEENRRIYDQMCAAFRAPRPPSVAVRNTVIPARAPDPPVRLREYRLETNSDPAGNWVLYLHGGGFVVGGLESHDDVCAEICAKSGLPTVAVAYRLAPEHVFPAALDDIWETYCFLLQKNRRVIVAGDSAGANLCAAICMRARRLGYDQPLMQVLIYPMLGSTSDMASFRQHADAPMLRATDCERYRAMYAGGRRIPDALMSEFAPLVAATFVGLAPAFVVTADIDPLRDEGKTYVARLREADVAAEWRNEVQLVHGFLRARHRSRRAAESFSAIVAAISDCTVS